jgi:hypothetical protein
LGVQHPQKRALDVARHQRPAVVERHAGTEMKDVALAPRISDPAIGERGENPAVGIELGEAVEDECDHLARRHVGRQRGVERAGIVGLVVDEASRLLAAAPAGAGRE